MISASSDTIFRLRETRDRDLYPLYEYLHLSTVQQVTGGVVSFNMGGWGRVDLADRTTEDHTNGDLQYGYLSYRGDRNNLVANLGRVWVTEGVASERIDGAYWRSDLAAGFMASAFAGRPVVTEPNALAGGDVIYGGRIAHSLPGLYTIGVSAVKTSQVDDGADVLEREGIDVWLHPVKQVDITGISSYSSRTSGWMENTYHLSLAPLHDFRVSADLSAINYRHYLDGVTTPALSVNNALNFGAGTSAAGANNGILNPNEELFMLGASVGYTLRKNLDLVADYRHFDYKVQGDAHYFGANLTYTPGTYSAGLQIHRMDGGAERLSYDEFRIWASRRWGKVDVTVDLFDVLYDHDINDVSNSFSISGAVGYQFSPRLRATADVEYMRGPDYENQLQGLIKLTYAFDVKAGTEGRAK
ncbi:hypothetical protein [Geomesophilobacter sediminis]|uniref:Uncharacterized protein n=1 Tax=Geomesophilobacter sediminis TaxID=2798584 RepID=A0A8J7M373_9BACT|nr:hypothetical protein [Geomesophilobacter sediminis]MBJ6727920.1 hypothetical protein [Geomesophilobacter sediminis]